MYFNRIFSTRQSAATIQILLFAWRNRENTLFFFFNPCPLMNEFLIFYTPSYRVWPGRRARTVFRYIIFYFLSISSVTLLSVRFSISFLLSPLSLTSPFVHITPFVMLSARKRRLNHVFCINKMIIITLMCRDIY